MRAERADGWCAEPCTGDTYTYELGTRQDPRKRRGSRRCRGTTWLLKMSGRTRMGRAKIARALYLNNAARLGIAPRRNSFNCTSRSSRAVPSTRVRERGSSKQLVYENKGGRKRERQGGCALVCILRRGSLVARANEEITISVSGGVATLKVRLGVSYHDDYSSCCAAKLSAPRAALRTTRVGLIAKFECKIETI